MLLGWLLVRVAMWMAAAQPSGYFQFTTQSPGWRAKERLRSWPIAFLPRMFRVPRSTSGNHESYQSNPSDMQLALIPDELPGVFCQVSFAHVRPCSKPMRGHCAVRRLLFSVASLVALWLIAPPRECTHFARSQDCSPMAHYECSELYVSDVAVDAPGQRRKLGLIPRCRPFNAVATLNVVDAGIL